MMRVTTQSTIPPPPTPTPTPSKNENENDDVAAHNRWSLPRFDRFRVRGKRYLSGDRQKVASQDYLLPLRSAEVYSTDRRPRNVGRFASVLDGRLREKPTFLINFRLPWAVFVYYLEIPERFQPYVAFAYQSDMDATEKTRLIQAMNSMTPGERCLCRFFMGDDEYKNQLLKIIPVVVKGPWIVRQAVGGKPAIIGKVLPIEYVYQPAEDGNKKAMYLEADLDICSSALARRILAVAKAHTHVLTLDLGFVIQGNDEDELPEQMLTACRLHGMNPDLAPPFPLSAVPQTANTEEEETEETEEDLTISSSMSSPSEESEDIEEEANSTMTRALFALKSLSWDGSLT